LKFTPVESRSTLAPSHFGLKHGVHRSSPIAPSTHCRPFILPPLHPTPQGVAVLAAAGRRVTARSLARARVNMHRALADIGFTLEPQSHRLANVVSLPDV